MGPVLWSSESRTDRKMETASWRETPAGKPATLYVGSIGDIALEYFAAILNICVARHGLTWDLQFSRRPIHRWHALEDGEWSLLKPSPSPYVGVR